MFVSCLFPSVLMLGAIARENPSLSKPPVAMREHSRWEDSRRGEAQGTLDLDAAENANAVVGALDLYKAASLNPAWFDLKLSGKRILVRGQLSKTETQSASDGKRAYIAWLSLGGGFAKPGVACSFADSRVLANVKTGEWLLVQGEAVSHRPLHGYSSQPLGGSAGGGPCGGQLSGLGDQQIGSGAGGSPSGPFWGGVRVGRCQLAGFLSGAGESGVSAWQAERIDYVDLRSCKIIVQDQKRGK